MKPYVPEAGDVVWLTFDPQVEREQAGRRPAFVLSPRSYNRVVGLAIVCPATSQAKGYPFEVAMPAVPPRLPDPGVILVDHLKSVDWKGRRAMFAATLPNAVLEQVRAKLKPVLAL